MIIPALIAYACRLWQPPKDQRIIGQVRDAVKLWAPPRELTVSQWADRYRYLSSESAAEHGKWLTLPFQREPLDSVSDPRIYRTVIRAATQMCKTITIENGIGYFAHQDPGPILVLQPRDADAKAFSKERIAPMIRDTPALKGIFTESKSRVSNNTIEEKLFPGGMLAITSAGSPGNLARRAIRFLFADEVDKYPPTAGAEGNPISLARKRLATFRHRKKEILTCSPTLPGSEIDRAYEASDKREYYVPCPDCGHMQSMMLKFYTQVRWDSSLPTREDQARSARYHCEDPDCGATWDDAARWKAVEHGEWRAHRSFNGIAGFWISELYSPWKQLSEIVLDFLSKKDSPEDLKTFVNTSLAENWIEKGEAPEWEILLAKRELRDPGTIPRGGLFLTAGADVQRDRIEVEAVAYGRGRESWSIDYQIFEGKTSEAEVWRKLEEFRAGTYPTENGVELPISRMFVDSGDGTTTQDVYNWVRKQPSGQVQAIKGSDRGILPVGPPSPVDVTEGGKKIKAGLKIRMINVSFFKSELYSYLKLRAPTEEEQAGGLSYPPGYCHFPSGQNYGDEHFKQLCAEQLVPRRNRRTGRIKNEWQQTRARNEVLDARVYARAASWDLGLDRMQDKHWEKLEAQLLDKVIAAKPGKVEGEQQVQTQSHRDPKKNSWLGDRGKNWLKR
jgi:phage terminase large subunit GpA-like protein